MSLDRCLIETDAPYLGGGREDQIYSLYFGSGGWRDFVRGSMYQGEWWGQFWHFRDFYVVAYERVGRVKGV